ncbi:MAG TPA: hypothetical protein GXX20_09900 [Clostridiaceae bacterium]|nr:hypothetical protein [Clostridiaceae bacterium]
MDLKVIQVSTKSDLKKFLYLPWKIYKGNDCWVPPLIKDLKDSLDDSKNPSMKKIKHVMYLALLDGKPVGRIFAGIDNELNSKKGVMMGHFSLFECIDNYDVAKSLFDTAIKWFKENKIQIARGPVSPTGTDDDESKGLLVNCFDQPPVIMNSYNPPYYKDFIERYGFTKDYDVFAYFLEPTDLFKKNPDKIIEYAKKKYNFTVESLSIKNIDKEVLDIKHVLDLAIPVEWPDLVPPSLEEIKGMVKKLLPYADPDLIILARSEGEAIGFGLALPDYNQLLIHLNGRITPISALKYLWYKRKINCARVFAMFVVPEFRKKGVSHAIYYQIFINGIKKGYKYGEASTIGETNVNMRKDIESIGAKHYKTYRIYSMKI